MWIKNSRGRKDAMLTFATISFFVVTMNIVLVSFSPVFEKYLSFSFVPVDIAILTMYMSSTFTAYVARKWTDLGKKEEQPNE
jgi:hypothetical protein